MWSKFTRLFGSRPNLGNARVSPMRQGSTFRPLVEGLEQREVMSASSLAPPALAPALVAQQAVPALLEITDINVTNVAVTGANQLTATLDIVGEVLGRQFTLNDVQVPINLSALQNPTNAECPILHLELEIEDLNLLGLHVELNNCEEGPLTVDIVAVPGSLLGDLLCGVSNLLDGGGSLLDLTESQLAGLTGAVQDILDNVLGTVLSDGTTGGGTTQQNGNGRRCDLVNLELGAINLNVLGLEVRTSDICLDVYAVRGGAGNGGGLLGNLLCGVANLLDNPGNPLNAINRLVDRILGQIGNLEL
jgi:hypothetical protein